MPRRASSWVWSLAVIERTHENFDDWYADLLKYVRELDVDTGYYADKDAWRDYWEDGFSPRDAVEEDMTYWE